MSSLIKSSSTDEQEDATSIFESSIYSLFDIHIAASGDPGCEISYSNPRLAAILPNSTLKYYIPKGDKEQNGLMAQFQWDAGLVLADLICESNEMESEVGRTKKEEDQERNGVALELDGSFSSKDSDRIRKESRSNSFKVGNKNTLELGAGTGLPSLIGGLLGSSKGVITDYPSPDILETLKRNILHLNHQLIPNQSHGSRNQLFVEGLEWGKKSHEELALR